jgi:hypothetical protein
MFYCPSFTNTATSWKLNATSRQSVSLEEVLHATPKATLDLCYQYELALKLTKAVLQFHSTPWLVEGWQIQDLAFFDHKGKHSEVDLTTLHLTSQLSDRKPNAPSSITAMEGVQSTSMTTLFPFQDLALDRGVHNLTLFHLGVALLQIGCWKTVEELRPQYVHHDTYQQPDPYDISTVRRVSGAGLLLPLGPKYERMVQKCLDCNFGSGKDLKEEALQSAITSQVVSELEAMIEVLKL